MFKTFAFGILLGIVGIGAAIYFVPAVDLHRERSFVEVRANGGNVEEFRIGIPRDRILVRQSGAAAVVPANLEWPEDVQLDGLQAELFKVRNRDDAVIGVASRMASSVEERGPFVEWAVHLPARGTVFARMGLAATADGRREGQVRAGTRDFESLTGTLTERFVADAATDESQGYIELSAVMVAPLEAVDDTGDEE